MKKSDSLSSATTENNFTNSNDRVDIISMYESEHVLYTVPKSRAGFRLLPLRVDPPEAVVMLSKRLQSGLIFFWPSI